MGRLTRLALFFRVYGSTVSVSILYALITLQDCYIVKTLKNSMRPETNGGCTFKGTDGEATMDFVQFSNPLHICIEISRVNLAIGSGRQPLVPIHRLAPAPVEHSSIPGRMRASVKLESGASAQWGIPPDAKKFWESQVRAGTVVGFEILVTYKSYFGFEQQRTVSMVHSLAWHLLQSRDYMLQLNRWELLRLRSKYPDMTI